MFRVPNEQLNRPLIFIETCVWHMQVVAGGSPGREAACRARNFVGAMCGLPLPFGHCGISKVFGFITFPI
jgi:hypothetical protein